MNNENTQTEIATQEVDVCWSEDDYESSGKGWYLMRFPDQKTSQLFEEKSEAVAAARNGQANYS